jgi:hypothetical protein
MAVVLPSAAPFPQSRAHHAQPVAAHMYGQADQGSANVASHSQCASPEWESRLTTTYRPPARFSLCMKAQSSSRLHGGRAVAGEGWGGCAHGGFPACVALWPRQAFCGAQPWLHNLSTRVPSAPPPGTHGLGFVLPEPSHSPSLHHCASAPQDALTHRHSIAGCRRSSHPATPCSPKNALLDRFNLCPNANANPNR